MNEYPHASGPWNARLRKLAFGATLLAAAGATSGGTRPASVGGSGSHDPVSRLEHSGRDARTIAGRPARGAHDPTGAHGTTAGATVLDRSETAPLEPDDVEAPRAQPQDSSQVSDPPGADTYPMTSSRPYLVRALYEWIGVNGLTPYLLADAHVEGVRVPEQHVENGQIILNIDPGAVDSLEIGNDEIVFTARFSGSPFDVRVPMEGVRAIYARENGKGMMFGTENR